MTQWTPKLHVGTVLISRNQWVRLIKSPKYSRSICHLSIPDLLLPSGWGQWTAASKQKWRAQPKGNFTENSDLPRRKQICLMVQIIWLCLEKEQLRAHSRSAGEELPEEHTRQQSSLAVQADSKIHLSPVATAEQSKNRLIIFLCFGYSQWPLTVSIWSSTGLWPTKHSFKYLTECQKEAKSCYFLPRVLHRQLRHPKWKFSQVTHAGLLKQNTLMQTLRGKKSRAQDHGGRAQTWASFIGKHETVWRSARTLVSWDSSKAKSWAGFCITSLLRHHFCQLASAQVCFEDLMVLCKSISAHLPAVHTL